MGEVPNSMNGIEDQEPLNKLYDIAQLVNGQLALDGATYWYLFRYEYCPVCGRERGWKERLYDRPKPIDREDRYVGTYINCHCESQLEIVKKDVVKAKSDTDVSCNSVPCMAR